MPYSKLILLIVSALKVIHKILKLRHLFFVRYQRHQDTVRI